MATQPLQTGFFRTSPRLAALRQFSPLAQIETWLEAERDQLGLWLPILLGGGIAAWFLLPNPAMWAGFIVASVGLALLGFTIGRGARWGSVLAAAGLLLAAGCGLIWGKSVWVAAPVLERPVVETFTARVERVNILAARDRVRLVVVPQDRKDLPPRFRVNVRQKDAPSGLGPGAVVTMKARLMPPAPPALPGGYDFARRAWFEGIGATGTALGVIRVDRPAPKEGAIRAQLSAHIMKQLDGGEGAIAAAFATGDQGGISEEDADAMRRSGLAHLLSISGLHVTAMVGGVMFLLLKLLALSPRLALRWNLLLVSAAGGALAGLCYTLLTGAEVPTIRSCIAALLVLGGFALGREAITLRLVATGALIVLVFWPEALIGPSFQLSFAAVTAIVALHQSPFAKRVFAKRDEGWGRAIGRNFASLLLTGLAVEMALIPISLVHFHKAGLYGAIANMVAIPLTTFVVMPLEALALLLDCVGLGAPFWWLTGKALTLLLGLAHYVANLPGAVSMVPTVPTAAVVATLIGGLWLLLWQSPIRRWGIIPLALGTIGLFSSGPPDLLISGDGRHIAARGEDGVVALLRERSGDYSRDMLAESAGVDGELMALKDMNGVRCSLDFCIWSMAGRSAEGDAGGQKLGWTIMASRSTQYVDVPALNAICQQVDIVISDRRLPRGCTPRWLRLDRIQLAESGGLALTLDETPGIRTVRSPAARHPWLHPPTVAPPKVWPKDKVKTQGTASKAEIRPKDGVKPAAGTSQGKGEEASKQNLTEAEGSTAQRR